MTVVSCGLPRRPSLLLRRALATVFGAEENGVRWAYTRWAERFFLSRVLFCSHVNGYSSKAVERISQSFYLHVAQIATRWEQRAALLNAQQAHVRRVSGRVLVVRSIQSDFVSLPFWHESKKAGGCQPCFGLRLCSVGYRPCTNISFRTLNLQRTCSSFLTGRICQEKCKKNHSAIWSGYQHLSVPCFLCWTRQ